MNIYGHVMPVMQQEAGGQIDAALAEADESEQSSVDESEHGSD
jgi:hypothetical protein